jgi:hypothetical protein
VLKGVEVGWPPLIDTETFYAVQRILTDPAAPHNPIRCSSGDASAVLGGYCGECGAKLVRKKGTS